MTIKSLFPLFLVFICFVSCKKEPIVTPVTDYKNVLTNLGNDVILETYKELDLRAKTLVNALVTLEKNQTAPNLEAARQAWRDARVPWEQSEGFLFGPVDQQGLDPSIDSWPVNQPDLDAVLKSNFVLNQAYVDGLDGTLKGFHTIEYLLFGADGNKSVNDFTARQFEYLRACSQSLSAATETLYFAWKPEQKNFIANILTAGTAGNTFYPSQKAALQEIIIGMVTIVDEVANGKINDPFSQKNLTLEESRFSANSKRDFADNIRSVQNAYLGTYKNNSGLGISFIIKAKNSVLDFKVKQELTDAIVAIEAIEGTFTTAVTAAPKSIENAQNKVRQLQQTLESEVAPILSNL
jgi:putative iron-regulated protein